MSAKGFIVNYCEEVYAFARKIPEKKLNAFCDLVDKVKDSGGKLIFVGNGGSAAISAHASIDFTKAARVPSTTFNETSLLTCFGNDYGYENWVVEALKVYAMPNDLVILISSSGDSANIVNAARWCTENEFSFVSFSGFSSSSKLASVSDLNFWVDSSSYNVVEMVHHLWLCGVVDFMASKN